MIDVLAFLGFRVGKRNTQPLLLLLPSAPIERPHPRVPHDFCTVDQSDDQLGAVGLLACFRGAQCMRENPKSNFPAASGAELDAMMSKVEEAARTGGEAHLESR